jgi:hypothetical protein
LLQEKKGTIYILVFGAWVGNLKKKKHRELVCMLGVPKETTTGAISVAQFAQGFTGRMVDWRRAYKARGVWSMS